MVRNVAIDALLVLGFGVQHSIFALLPVKRVVRRVLHFDPVTWRSVQSLLNISYVIVAALLWRDIPTVLWDLHGAAYWVLAALLAAGWVWYFQLHIFEYDAGLAFGSSAAIARSLGRPVPRLETWKTGSRRWLRFPVHTAFFPMFLAFPRMTVATLTFGIAANFYNLLGSVLYDRRLERTIGKPYFTYETRTGLVFPPLRRSPQGAGDLELPRPRHWDNPAANLPGTVLGLLGGLAYWSVLGVVHRTSSEVLAAVGIAVALALVGGVSLGLVKQKLWRHGDLSDETRFNDLLAELGVNAAIMSAVSLLTWVSLSLVSTGQVPHAAVYLPMWIIVLWMGHVVGFAAGQFASRSTRRVAELDLPA